MISTWIGYPLYSESTLQSSSHPQSNAAAGQAHPRATPGATRTRCSRQRSGHDNRRDSGRTAHTAEITLDLLGMKASSRQRTVKAQMVNAAEGGLCVVLSKSLLPSSVIRCRFGATGLPAGVPTLLQVRWVKAMPNGKYSCGLMYLL